MTPLSMATPRTESSPLSASAMGRNVRRIAQQPRRAHSGPQDRRVTRATHPRRHRDRELRPPPPRKRLRELIIEARQKTPLDTALNHPLEHRKPAYAPQSQFSVREHRRAQVHHHETPPHCPYQWFARTFDENLGSQNIWMKPDRTSIYRPPTPGFGRTGRSSARRFAAARATFNWR